MSKNAGTIEQIMIACKNFYDLKAAGVTENLAIRVLELLANSYAKYRKLGHTRVDHVSQYERWSLRAIEAERSNPGRKSGEYLRVEHGTPRRQFARMILQGFEHGHLTKDWLDDLCDRMWRVAVITHEEDRQLARSKACDDPEERWRDAGIELLVRPTSDKVR